jgi:hypothetical protein
VAFGSWAQALRYFSVSMSPDAAARSAAHHGGRARGIGRKQAAQDAEIGAEIDEAREIAQRAQALARYEVRHGLEVCAVREDARRVYYMLR